MSKETDLEKVQSRSTTDQASEKTIVAQTQLRDGKAPASEPTKTQASQVGGSKQAQQGTLRVGASVNNRFIIEELLGHGGMGVVYRALDLRKKEAQDPNPYIAIKVLNEDFSRHPEAFIALQRESVKSQALSHPNIITVYDFDRDGDNVYMTMEQLFGSPLDEVIAANPKGLPVEQATHIIHQIALGLDYAHSNLIVHSDLKPANIFVTDKNHVKILDFGIARAAANREEAAGNTTIFDAGSLGGLTPSYASYEMFHGADPHASDDVYALGIISYEVLTGRHPYHRKTAVQAANEKIDVAKIRPIQRHKWQAIARALEIQREQRLASTEQFLKKFLGLSRTIKLLIFALALTTIVLGSLALYRPDKPIGPDTAFEDLPAAVQQKVVASLKNGDEALAFDDLNGALFFYNAAYETHPRNPNAVEGLNTVVEQLIANINLNADTDALNAYSRQVSTVLAYSALAENKELKALQAAIDNKLGRALPQ